MKGIIDLVLFRLCSKFRMCCFCCIRCKFKISYDLMRVLLTNVCIKIGRLGGGGSDYSAFVQHIGIPSVDMTIGSGLFYFLVYILAFINNLP